MAGLGKMENSISHSVPCSPTTKKATKTVSLPNTLILEIVWWLPGVPTPIGSMSPNEQAISLITGFATGNVIMNNGSIKHLSTDSSISKSLGELPWDTPKRKRTDGQANRTKKAKIAEKEPRKTIAKQLVEQKPRTQVPDSEIRIENTTPGSPIFVPFHRVKPVVTGKGKGKKDIKLNQDIKQAVDSCSMARTKQTETKEQRARQLETEH